MDLIDLIEQVRKGLAYTVKKSLDDFIEFDKAIVDNEEEYAITTICEAPEGITWAMLSDVIEDLIDNEDDMQEYGFIYKGVKFSLNHDTFVGDFQINYEKESEE